MEKVAIVTGSTSGIGLETSLALARGGYRTYAGMRDRSRGRALLEAARGLPLEAVDLDVDSDASVGAAAGRVASEAGRIDVLVNNAGYGQFGCAEDVTVGEFKAQFETNFFGVVRMLHAVAPVMRRQGSGAIVNVSSVAGRIGLPASPAYISSKFALEGLGECLRYELGQFGIRTTLIEPGVIKTGFLGSMRVPASSADPKYGEMASRILSGIGMMVEMATEPAEVARAIMGALSDGDGMLPRYPVGADARMFLEARRARTDAEFEEYMRGELFPG